MAYKYREIGQRFKKRVIFVTADDFMEAAMGYFQWAEEHKLREEVSYMYKGDIVVHQKPKVRVFTKSGLALHLGIPVSRIDGYKNREGQEWKDAVELCEEIIYTQKFENAAAGLLNSNIICRSLGLTDKQEVDQKVSGKENTPPVSIELVTMAKGTFLPPPEENSDTEFVAIEDTSSEVPLSG